MKNLSLITMLLLLFVVGSASTYAASGDDHHVDAHHGQDSHHATYPTHVVGLVAGVTRDYKDETDATFGLEYEYRFSSRFGVGAVIERTPDGHHDDGVTVKVATLHLHPFDHGHALGGLRLTLGAGQEKIGGHDSEELWRLAVGYDIEIGQRFAIEPTAAVDYVDGEKINVFGIVFMTHF